MYVVLVFGCVSVCASCVGRRASVPVALGVGHTGRVAEDTHVGVAPVWGEKREEKACER